MHANSLASLAILAFPSSLLAQSVAPTLVPVSGLRDAGDYHVATGTWTRPGAVVGCWDDVLFDNTCFTRYYAQTGPFMRTVDDGRIPSTSSPEIPGVGSTPPSWTGSQDAYLVNYFQIGYCTLGPRPDFEISFWDCFSGCSNSTLSPPSATIVLSNVPGGTGVALNCWVVGIDLANSGQAFLLNADCDGLWNGGGAADTFGWSWLQTSPSLMGSSGPLVTGDPLGYLAGGPGSSGCDWGANTVFYAGHDSGNSSGSGLDGQDMWEVDIAYPTMTFFSCWWLQGYFNGFPYASFHLEIRGDAGASPLPPGVPYCPGDGIPPHTPCPFGNNNDGSMGGCDWANPGFPGGAVLTAFGSDSWASNDTYLVATAVENDFGVFFGANHRTNGGNGNPLNDGLRCAGGGVIRLTSPTPVSGNQAVLSRSIQALDLGGGVGVTRRYQYWFRTPSGPGGTLANLTNGYQIAWL